MISEGPFKYVEKGGCPMTETEQIKALRRGSVDALAELIDRYTPYISSVLARILVGRRADAGPG